jgi:hypothetical protein
MTEVNIALRYNEQTQEVELKVGDEVVGTSGKEQFAYWAELWATANGYTNTPAPVVEPVEEVVVTPTPAPAAPAPEVVAPVAEVVAPEVAAEVDKTETV